MKLDFRPLICAFVVLRYARLAVANIRKKSHSTWRRSRNSTLVLVILPLYSLDWTPGNSWLYSRYLTLGTWFSGLYSRYWILLAGLSGLNCALCPWLSGPKSLDWAPCTGLPWLYFQLYATKTSILYYDLSYTSTVLSWLCSLCQFPGTGLSGLDFRDWIP